MKAWCVCCEDGDYFPKNGYLWIHRACAEKVMDVSGDIEAIKEILKGQHHRNKLHPTEDRLKLVEDFLKDMEDFKRKWEGSLKWAESVGGKKK